MRDNSGILALGILLCLTAAGALAQRDVGPPPGETIAAPPARAETATPEPIVDLAEAVSRPDVHSAGVAELLEQGLTAHRRGDFAHAADVFAAAVRAASEDNVASRIDAEMLLSDAYQALGMANKRLQVLQSAQSLVAGDIDPVQLALLDTRLASVYASFGLPADAKTLLDTASELARSTARPGLAAAVLNDLGTVHVALGDYEAAIAAFRESHELAANSADASKTARAAVNLSRAVLEKDPKDGGLVAALNAATRAVGALPATPEKAESLLAVADLIRTAQRARPGPAAWRLTALETLNQARTLAIALGDRRTESYALGYIGRLYEDEGRYDEALRYTREAAFAAQGVDAHESLYRWEWQNARLLRAQGSAADALAAYRQAIATLRNIRSDLIGSGDDTFGRLIAPMYSEFADLLLTQTATLESAEAIQTNLLEVRNTLEQLKVAEVEDYFEHECILPETERTRLENVASNSAVIYPVVLANRTEILVSLPEGLRVFTARVDAETLTAEVRQFRLSLEAVGGGDEYLTHGKRLYDWLVAPLTGELERQRVDTLVFIPDAVLRSIPMAALHDGEQFLIAKYSVSTTLGLELTSPRPTPRENVQVLLAGISEAVQGFSALPAVGAELQRIGTLYPSATVLKDGDFLLGAAVSQMSEGSYSIIHIASHGQFDRDHRKSFVLTYDDRLTMNRIESSVGLRRFLEEPLELLVLSACQTAAGDDRAALGLAGVALQAGARSALATLWSVDDTATSELISDFYARLTQDATVSKAEALRQAQLELVRERAPPRLWAPFLLIGNWL